jgi:hypothetical protein
MKENDHNASLAAVGNDTTVAAPRQVRQLKTQVRFHGLKVCWCREVNWSPKALRLRCKEK